MQPEDNSFGGLFDDGFVGVTRIGGTAVARIGCASVRERQAMIVRETLTEVARQTGGRLLVGLAEVCSISAACLGDFTALKEMCEELGGRLVLFGLSEDLVHALGPTGLFDMLDIAPDQESAALLLKERPAREPAWAPDLASLDAGPLSTSAALRRDAA